MVETGTKYRQAHINLNLVYLYMSCIAFGHVLMYYENKKATLWVVFFNLKNFVSHGFMWLFNIEGHLDDSVISFVQMSIPRMSASL